MTFNLITISHPNLQICKIAELCEEVEDGWLNGKSDF